MTLNAAIAACREAEREGLLGLYPQAALCLERELNCVLGRLDECRKLRNGAILALAELQQPQGGAFPWWCPHCQKGVSASEVTYEETHDLKSGGCGVLVQPVPVKPQPAPSAQQEIAT